MEGVKLAAVLLQNADEEYPAQQILTVWSLCRVLGQILASLVHHLMLSIAPQEAAKKRIRMFGARPRAGEHWRRLCAIGLPQSANAPSAHVRLHLPGYLSTIVESIALRDPDEMNVGWFMFRAKQGNTTFVNHPMSVT